MTSFTPAPKPPARPAKPRKPIKRGKLKKRAKPVKRQNVKRRRSAFARAFHSVERVEWIKAQPCVTCGGGPCQNHHTRNGGQGRKADAKWIVPLCAACHRELHNKGTITRTHLCYPHITVTYKPEALRYRAMYTDQRWLAHCGGQSPDEAGR